MLEIIREAPNRINNVEVGLPALGDSLFALKCGDEEKERGALFCHHCLASSHLLPATEADDNMGGRRRKRTSKVSSGNQEEEEPPRTPLNKIALCPFCLDPSCSALVNFNTNSRQEITSMKKNRKFWRDHYGEETTCCDRKW